MDRAQPVRMAGAAMDVVVPAPARRLAGVGMAGFRGRAADIVEFPLVPYPASTLILDFGDTRLIDETTGDRQHGRVVVGMAPRNVRGGGRDVDLLQVRLSPVVAHAVLGASAELTGAIISLDDVWGPEARRVQERLHAAESWEARFAVLADALIRRRCAGREVDAEVAITWRRMMAEHGRTRIDGLADAVGWSRQRLWSRFRAQIGLTPKRAATLIRFDRVAHRLAAGHSPSAVAADSGFVDQSHLHRDTMAFAGLTPTELATAPWLAVDDVAWPTQA